MGKDVQQRKFLDSAGEIDRLELLATKIRKDAIENMTKTCAEGECGLIGSSHGRRGFVPSAQIEIETGYDRGIPTQRYLDLSKTRGAVGYQPDFKKAHALREFMESL